MPNLGPDGAKPPLNFDLESVVCAFCGSKHHEFYIRQAKEHYIGLDAWFDVVRCTECGFVFTNPRPTATTVGCFYPDSARYYQPKEKRVEREEKRLLRGKRQRARLARHLGYPFRTGRLGKLLALLSGDRDLRLEHIPRYIPGGRLLDIGCAWGGYLGRMRMLGWAVQGLELNPRAADYARRELGLDVFTGTFEDFDAPPESFDVIHMSMVLEHLYSPLRALEKIHALLRAEGQLILSVPDIDGVEPRIFKGHFYSLHVPQHVNHFSPRTMTSFLTRAGFQVDRIVHQKSRKDLLKSASYLDNQLPYQILNFAPIRSLLVDPFAALLARLGCSARMSVFAVKASTVKETR